MAKKQETKKETVTEEVTQVVEQPKAIKSKSKKPHVKFLGLEKSFLSNKKLTKIRMPIFYYTVKRKDLFKKYKNTKNLIFENL